MKSYRTYLNIFKVLFALLFSSISLYSQDRDIVIKEISFSGLKRTKESVLLRVIKPVSIGSIYSEDVEEIIIQKLREPRIFNPEISVSTEIIENEAFISVAVKDKWTLIPIPVVSVSKGESWKVGLLTLESNFLGYYKILGLGFFFGSQGWSLLSFFQDPYFLNTDLVFNTSFLAGVDSVKDLNVDETVLRTYESDKFGIQFELAYPITDYFTVAGGLEYGLAILKSDSPYTVPNLNTLGFNGRLAIKDLYFDIPYERGFKAEVKGSAFWDINKQNIYPIFLGKISWSFRPWFKHQISLNGEAGWGLMPLFKQFRLGGLNSSRILPRDKIGANEYAAASLVYNLPIWIFKGGAISLKAFYEIGYFKSDLVDRTLFHGPGFGLELFINNLAIPAIELNLGWNLATEVYQFSAGVGTR